MEPTHYTAVALGSANSRTLILFKKGKKYSTKLGISHEIALKHLRSISTPTLLDLTTKDYAEMLLKQYGNDNTHIEVNEKKYRDMIKRTLCSLISKL